MSRFGGTRAWLTCSEQERTKTISDNERACNFVTKWGLPKLERALRYGF